jgi:Transposase IS116/IS110/IS902 family
VVRYAGLDVTVYASDTKRSPGHLARQGPEVLRWALFEAAKSSARRTAPDHACYRQVKDRLSANRATCRPPASWPATPATSWSSWARRGWPRSAASCCPRCWLSRCPRPPEVIEVRAVPTAQQLGRGRLRQGSCRHALAWTTQKDRAAAHPGDHPIDHLVAAPWREHPDKGGRPGTHHLTAALPEPARR